MNILAVENRPIKGDFSIPKQDESGNGSVDLGWVFEGCYCSDWHLLFMSLGNTGSTWEGKVGLLYAFHLHTS